MTRRVPPPLRAMLPVLDGAVSAEQLAETVVMIVESWLRQCARDGYPQPGRQARAVLARIALGSPATAATCPLLLYAVGPRVAYAVKQQASALAASEIAAAACRRPPAHSSGAHHHGGTRRLVHQPHDHPGTAGR